MFDCVYIGQWLELYCLILSAELSFVLHITFSWNLCGMELVLLEIDTRTNICSTELWFPAFMWYINDNLFLSLLESKLFSKLLEKLFCLTKTNNLITWWYLRRDLLLKPSICINIVNSFNMSWIEPWIRTLN